jgi:hypothetical protein
MQVCLKTPREFLAVGVLGLSPESLRLASNRNFGDGSPALTTPISELCAPGPVKYGVSRHKVPSKLDDSDSPVIPCR